MAGWAGKLALVCCHGHLEIAQLCRLELPSVRRQVKRWSTIRTFLGEQKAKIIMFLSQKSTSAHQICRVIFHGKFASLESLRRETNNFFQDIF